MVNLKRLEELTEKLHDLLSQAQEIKRMIQERKVEPEAESKAEPEETASTNSEELDCNEGAMLQQPEPKRWCCCFSRKRKLN